jgi:hypothetical protein
MRVGYARTSSVEQQAGLDAQCRDLKGAECEKIFSDKHRRSASASSLKRRSISSERATPWSLPSFVALPARPNISWKLPNA